MKFLTRTHEINLVYTSLKRLNSVLPLVKGSFHNYEILVGYYMSENDITRLCDIFNWGDPDPAKVKVKLGVHGPFNCPETALTAALSIYEIHPAVD